MNRLNKRSGVATQIGIIILCLVICGLLYAALNNAVGQFQTWQVINYGSGVFTPVDIYNFIMSGWVWLPLFLLLMLVLWGVRQAQRRGVPTYSDE